MKYAMLPAWSRRFFPIALCLVLLAGLSTLTVHGSTIVPPRDLGELANMSQAVLLARAGISTSITRGGLIFTETTFEVVEVVRGTLQQNESISVETYGGVVDGIGWAVAGNPVFAEDTVYLLFLNRRGRSASTMLVALR